jgi:RIO kinase 1
MVDAALGPLVADGLVDEVLARLKSGKEADLWLVRHGEEVLAAKVYKAREARSFKNNAAYKEGRLVRDTRTQRAMARGSRFGRAAAEDAWKTKEADALFALHAAGVRVPRPVTFYEGVLLMEVVVDAGGRPAPRLVDAHVARGDAAALYADLRSQVVRMLGCDLIHGDLSPYNVLLGRDGPVVIDFPQVVGAAHNSQAESFLRRDLDNLRRFLAHLDPTLHAAAGDAREIWRAYTRRELTPDFVPRPSEPARQGGEHGRAHGTEPTRHGGAPRREFRPEPRRAGPRGGPPPKRGAPAPAHPPAAPHAQHAQQPPRAPHAAHPPPAPRAPQQRAAPPVAGPPAAANSPGAAPGAGRRRRRRRRRAGGGGHTGS